MQIEKCLHLWQANEDRYIHHKSSIDPFLYKLDKAGTKNSRLCLTILIVILLGIHPTDFKTYICIYIYFVYNSFIYNHPKPDVIKISFKRWINKETVVHSYNRMSLSNNKRCYRVIQRNGCKCILLPEVSLKRLLFYYSS